MASVVDICNLALSQLGAQNIASLDEASTEARACRQFYELVRDSLVSGYPWGFAERRLAMAELVNDRGDMWGHCYLVPQDALKVLGLDRGGVYDLAAGRLYTNVDKAVLVYTAKIEDGEKFPPLFIQALAYQLASLLAVPLTKSVELQGRMLELAARATAQAQMMDAADETHATHETNEFVKARG